jgi:hypothetical protein
MTNPRKNVNWEARSSHTNGLLLKEFVGLTDASLGDIHLSNGGHFENVGVYELIRRRCRFIIASDAGTDAGNASDNMANMLRLIRTDCGVSVDTRGHQTDSLAGNILREFIREWEGRPGMQVLMKALGLTGHEGEFAHDLLERTKELDASSRALWAITFKHSGRDCICGYSALLKYPNANKVELLVYVRGAYRQVGAGTAGLRAAQDYFISQHLQLSHQLEAHYPSSGMNAGERLARAQWIQFFGAHGFRRELPSIETSGLEHGDAQLTRAIMPEAQITMRWQPEASNV